MGTFKLDRGMSEGKESARREVGKSGGYRVDLGGIRVWGGLLIRELELLTVE